MKKYFYSDGIEKLGPVSLDELKQGDITKDTLIWFEGLGDWTPARDIEELKPILELKPPPIPMSDNDINNIENTNEEQQKEALLENQNTRTIKKIKKRMFSQPFSFKGRIGRTEYGISLLIVFTSYFMLFIIKDLLQISATGLAFVLPQWMIVFFLWAQGAKRCHDMGRSGWLQIIPFYVLWMIFTNGESGSNLHGVNPKG